MNRAALFLFAGGLIFGAARPENSTYVDGNVAALKPNTGGTLVFDNDSAMTFRTGLAEVAIPYKEIRKAEAGATQSHSHTSAPAYKVWTLPQRLHRTETQMLTVQYKNDKGEDQTMTLEMPKTAAASVLSEIETHTTPGAKNTREDWWGDKYWKTSRNAGQWDSNTVASKE